MKTPTTRLEKSQAKEIKKLEAGAEELAVRLKTAQSNEEYWQKRHLDQGQETHRCNLKLFDVEVSLGDHKRKLEEANKQIKQLTKQRDIIREEVDMLIASNSHLSDANSQQSDLLYRLNLDRRHEQKENES